MNTMIQEYLAFGIFILALIFAAISLVKFLISQIQNTGNSQCNANCNCSAEKKLKPKPLSVRGGVHRHSRGR